MTKRELEQKIEDARKEQSDVIILSIKEAVALIEQWEDDVWEARESAETWGDE